MPGEEEEEEVSKEETGIGRHSSSHLFTRQIDAGQRIGKIAYHDQLVVDPLRQFLKHRTKEIQIGC